MTVREAITFFRDINKITNRLRVLDEVGLGYLRLGQSATTLSGGEAQRVKLAAHLSKRAGARGLYIFDEPTTGLHFDDINKLLAAFRALIDAGGSLLVIEHNLDVIKTADYVEVVLDRKSTRLNSSHSQISYAVFCLKKKKKN